MKKLKRLLRLLGLICLVLMASFGVAPFLFNTREKYMDKEVKIELSESRENENELKTIEQKT